LTVAVNSSASATGQESTAPSPISVSGTKRSTWIKLRRDPRVIIAGCVLGFASITAVFAPWLAPFDPQDMDISLRLAPPSSAHWLGCDLNGGDVLTAMIYGARTSLYVGFLTVLLSLTIGVAVGLVAGYKRGAVDTIFMRLVDLLMAFPGILLAMALTALLGPSVHNVVLAIAATGWTSSARLVRGQVLSVAQRDFVVACRALGARDFRILFKHVFPATWSPLVVHATFSLSGVILIEASLSFLGLGAQDSAPSWGAILGQGRTVLMEAPHLSLAPGLAIMLIVLALNFLGDALRDTLDPRGN